jgi:hypothetical protein
MRAPLYCEVRSPVATEKGESPRGHKQSVGGKQTPSSQLPLLILSPTLVLLTLTLLITLPLLAGLAARLLAALTLLLAATLLSPILLILLALLTLVLLSRPIVIFIRHFTFLMRFIAPEPRTPSP